MSKSLRSSLTMVYGPYVARTGNAAGRRIVELRYRSGKKRVVSYPKFLVEFLLDRELDPLLETIDHIDGDFDNNDWCNLRIIDLSTHVAQDAQRAASVSLVCVFCGAAFTRSGNQTRNNSKSGKAGPFCSRSCAGKYSASVQYGRRRPLPPQAPHASVLAQPEKHGGILVSIYQQSAKVSEQDVLFFISSLQAANRAQILEKRKAQREARKARREANKSGRRQRAYTLDKGRKVYGYCQKCGGPIFNSNAIHFCSYACAHAAQRKASWPSQEELHDLVWSMPTSKVAKRFGVSDKAVEKWCKNMGVEKPPRGYWAKVKAGKIPEDE